MENQQPLSSDIESDSYDSDYITFYDSEGSTVILSVVNMGDNNCSTEDNHSSSSENENVLNPIMIFDNEEVPSTLSDGDIPGNLFSSEKVNFFYYRL